MLHPVPYDATVRKMAVPNWDVYNTSIEKCRQDQFKQLEGTYRTHKGIGADSMLAIVVLISVFL